MATTQSCPLVNLRNDRMPAILRDNAEVKIWLGETPATAAELKTPLRPFDGSLVMREQEPGGPPPKPHLISSGSVAMENREHFLCHHRLGEMGPLVDGCSIELFDNDGEVVANFIFTSNENARRAHKALELVMGEAFSVTRAA